MDIAAPVIRLDGVAGNSGLDILDGAEEEQVDGFGKLSGLRQRIGFFEQAARHARVRADIDEDIIGNIDFAFARPAETNPERLAEHEVEEACHDRGNHGVEQELEKR